MKKVTVNKEQKLYVLASNGGYSCLGFSVVERKVKALCIELSIGFVPCKIGTIKMYKQYLALVENAKVRYNATGVKSNIELIPEFIGKEGYRVQIIDKYGETRRFIIGKSSGFIPCHLEIAKSNSRGGAAVCGYPFKSINFIERVR